MRKIALLTMLLCVGQMVLGQTSIEGIVSDGENNDPIIGGTVIIANSTIGTTTDWDGSFTINTDQSYPITLEVSYIGYKSKTVEVVDNSRLDIRLENDAVVIQGVEVKATRISEKQKESPLTVEALDNIAIKETPAADFYDGLGALKGVDLTAASLGFKVINTRGFNSTSPVRSLQIIDGVDNQAPGLNFSLGNFLGSSELDVNKVEIVVGASSAFYGPNAFNGVISMETKNPFFHDGLSASLKVGERNLMKGALRWAQKFQNKDGNDNIAYKLNLELMRADDWVAENYDPIDDSLVDVSNPGGYDAVNIYGDEYQSGNDFSDQPISNKQALLRTWYRTGYREQDLVDYGTRNYKANAAIHFKTKPSKGIESPEFIVSSSYGAGTTVYQGDNRFSLRNITFLQNRLELKKTNKYFIRAYTTRTGAGDSYDPYFTALELQKAAKSNDEWTRDYTSYWVNNIADRFDEYGYPEAEVIFDPVTGLPSVSFDNEGARQWLIDNNTLVTDWQNESRDYADNVVGPISVNGAPYYKPGTDRFDQKFEEITSTLRDPKGEGFGTKFYDNSALYHAHGEYIFTPTWVNKITVGANGRLYTPKSKGTVFSDSTETISVSEVGAYAGIEKSFANNKLKASGTIRADKNQNFDLLISPAASLVYTPSANNFLRVSFSSAIRNPTLSDQYLFLDVGRATLSGNLNGVDSLVTIESLTSFLNTQNADSLKYFNIDPIQPEQVQTLELGYRTTLFEKVYLDASYYFSQYTNFIGYQLGADLDYSTIGGLGINSLEAYRYSANSKETVQTQGASIGLNYYFASKYALNGNYSWNKLVKTNEDDPIIPAFNTPEHKFNLGLSGRNLDFRLGNSKHKCGFNINYKWVEGFLFEGSPQFTGFVPTYDMLDVQFNVLLKKIDTTIKIGASNALDNRKFQTYGGPRIGRLAYIAFTYQPE